MKLLFVISILFSINSIAPAYGQAQQEGEKLMGIELIDRNNKKVNLSDFEGKVLYIDVWATWCMPCRKQFPNLKAMEEDYKNDNIVFIGLSVDHKKDKWLEFLTKRELHGIQLYSENKGIIDFMEYYGIEGIPHYILVDKNGIVVSNDAPRPTQPEIDELIGKLLN